MGLLQPMEVLMSQVDVLRIDLRMDEEVLDALVICVGHYPELDFAALIRELLVAEACSVLSSTEAPRSH